MENHPTFSQYITLAVMFAMSVFIIRLAAIETFPTYFA